MGDDHEVAHVSVAVVTVVSEVTVAVAAVPARPPSGKIERMNGRSATVIR